MNDNAIPDEFAPEANLGICLEWEARTARWAAMVCPVLGLALMPVFRSALSFVVSLKAPDTWVRWAAFRDPAAWLLPVALTLGSIAWGLAVRRERAGMTRRPMRFPYAAAGAIVLVVLANFAIRNPRVVWTYAEMAKLRTDKYSFAHAVASWYAKSALASPHRRGAEVVIAGSSQANSAVDAATFAAASNGLRAEKWCLPGFAVLQYPMCVPDLLKTAPKVVLCMISEFDLFREERLPTNRLRFFAHAQEALRLSTELGSGEAWRQRSGVADLLFASGVPLWRPRDLTRRLASDLWWRFPQASRLAPDQDPTNTARQRENLKRSVRRTALTDVSFRSFRQFARQVLDANTQLLVIEGFLHPATQGLYDTRFRDETRERLRAMSRELGFEYVDQSGLPAFPADRFLDLYHLDRQGQEEMTRVLAARISRMLGS